MHAWLIVPLLTIGASVISAAAARYAALHSRRVDRMLDRAYDAGWFDADTSIVLVAERHAAALEAPPVYSPDTWLHDELEKLHAWGEQQRAKSARLSARIIASAPRELPAGPAQLRLGDWMPHPLLADPARRPDDIRD
jgi:hypothetical protein